MLLVKILKRIAYYNVNKIAKLVIRIQIVLHVFKINFCLKKIAIYIVMLDIILLLFKINVIVVKINVLIFLKMENKLLMMLFVILDFKYKMDNVLVKLFLMIIV